MRTIAELNVLLRGRVELPADRRLATDQFREGWEFVRSGGVLRLERKIRRSGWNFIKIADGLFQSGVGETSQKAIANALKLVLRGVSGHFNAVELERIELTRYPWFFLARVLVRPYRIQQDAVCPVPDQAATDEILIRSRRLPVGAAFPHFGSAMPLPKKMPASSRNSQARVQ
jgi:hypothetical protein